MRTYKIEKHHCACNAERMIGVEGEEKEEMAQKEIEKKIKLKLRKLRS